MDSKFKSTLIRLSDLYNLIVITNPVSNTFRVLVVNQWVPIQGQITYNTVTGKDITNYFHDNSMYSMVGSDVTSFEMNNVVRQTIETKIDSLSVIKYQFSSQFLWEIIEKSF